MHLESAAKTLDAEGVGRLNNSLPGSTLDTSTRANIYFDEGTLDGNLALQKLGFSDENDKEKAFSDRLWLVMMIRRHHS